ncbi:MAG: glutaredoxin family protein [Candidatus Dormibacteria bacterium]
MSTEAADQEPAITIYTTAWCGDCRAAKRVLNSEGVAYTEVDITDDDAARKRVQEINGGYQTVPTILFKSGRIVIEPSSPQLMKVLREEGLLA